MAGLSDLSAKDEQRLKAMVNAISNKFLHHPINYMKAKNCANNTLPATTIREIFKLDEDKMLK